MSCVCVGTLLGKDGMVLMVLLELRGLGWAAMSGIDFPRCRKNVVQYSLAFSVLEGGTAPFLFEVFL